MAMASFVNKMETNHDRMGVNGVLLVCGDFNCSEVRWVGDANGAPMVPISSGGKHASVVDAFSFVGLEQFNFIRNCYGKLLDLILCNRNGIVNLMHCEEPFVPEDAHHPCVEFLVDFGRENYLRGFTDRFVYRFNSADYVAINNRLLELNWDLLLCDDSVNENVQQFYNIIYDLISELVPKKKLNKKFPPYYSKQTISFIKKKQKYHRRWKNYGNLNDQHLFKYYRSRSKLLLAADYKKYISKIEQELPGNTG